MEEIKRNQGTMAYLSDTIVGLATPPGVGGVAIVRLSGPESIALADRLFKSSKISLVSAASHTLSYGHFELGDTISDEVLVSVMRAPKSYTRENVVEINAHGGVRLAEKMVLALVKRGARRAEKGEFTERAYLNGRIDLTQAEAVLQMVEARTEGGLSAACFQLHGGLSEGVWRIGESISGALARIEVGLEFVEDQFMSDVGNPKAELDGLTSVRDEVGELLRSYDRGKLATVGATVVLVGAPNVGKSSLLNTLLGHERAIVTPVPGTTRDVVEGEIDLDGIRVRLLDTAGIRDTDDVVEQEGTRRARAAAERSDLSVLVLDGSGAVPLNLESWPVHGIVALNKWDIRVKEVESEAIRNVGETPLVRTTATTGDGIGDLCGAIASALTEGIPDPTGAVVLSERHADALSQTAEALDRALVEAKGRGEADLVAADLRLALDSVGLITGETTPDDVLRAIFDGFCVGK